MCVCVCVLCMLVCVCVCVTNLLFQESNAPDVKRSEFSKIYNLFDCVSKILSPENNITGCPDASFKDGKTQLILSYLVSVSLHRNSLTRDF